MEDSERTPLLLRPVGRRTALVRPSTQRKLACAAVLLAEMFERVACYSLSGTLVFFLTKAPFCWDSPLATSLELIFTAVMYVTGLFGGWISDSYLGRYSTIIIGYIIYLVGYIYMPILAYWPEDPSCSYIEPIAGSTPCNCSWTTNSTPLFCNAKVDGEAACSTPLYIFLILIAIGAGMVNVNLPPFGGDQVSPFL